MKMPSVDAKKVCLKSSVLSSISHDCIVFLVHIASHNLILVYLPLASSILWISNSCSWLQMLIYNSINLCVGAFQLPAGAVSMFGSSPPPLIGKKTEGEKVHCWQSYSTAPCI